MENTDAPGVRGEPGERRASGRGRDSLDAHFFFADVQTMPPIKTHEVSYKPRCAVQVLCFNAGWTYQRIADDQNLGVSMVWDICQAQATHLKRKGKPFSINSLTQKTLIAVATRVSSHRQMPFTTIVDISRLQAC